MYDVGERALSYKKVDTLSNPIHLLESVGNKRFHENAAFR
ncbi:MAG: hypothetical protein KatS3mg031_2404 [Chitinophagales bacterium]|nr:MAG: hypothetical protein KatS3mg031_2404 [Chitinophagales bacterium]